MADIPEEHLTEELLDRLLASASIEQYPMRDLSAHAR